jgi:hypothetical protein
VRGLKTKLQSLRLFLPTLTFNIVCFSESWLDDTIQSKELGSHRFNIFRQDRDFVNSDKSRGGGVVTFVHPNFTSKLICSVSNNCEAVFVLVSHKTEKFIIGNVYIPPDAIVDTYVELFEIIGKLKGTYSKAKLILVGDFNIPKIAWDDFHSPKYYGNDIICNTVLEFCSFHNLLQFNLIKNQYDRVLDLVLSDLQRVSVQRASDCFEPIDSYHPPLEIQYTTSTLKCSGNPHTRPNFKLANFDSMEGSLSDESWNFLSGDSDLNVKVEKFYSTIKKVIDLNVPITKCFNSSYPKWMTKDLINCIKSNKIAHQLCKQTNNLNDYSRFCHLRLRVKKLTRKCYTGYIDKMESNIQRSPHETFNLFRSLCADDPGIPSFMSFGSKVASGSSGTANLFAEYFGEVYKENYVKVGGNKLVIRDILDLSGVVLLESEIAKMIDSLNTQKTEGPDGIPNLFLVKCKHSILKPLTIIFNESLKLGVFPDMWKVSYLNPIFKKGERTDVTNYRPICIQSAIPKLFEAIFLQKFAYQINRAVSSLQHGFVMSCHSSKYIN